MLLEQSQVADAATIYEGWWKEADPVTDAEIAEFGAIPPISRGAGPEEGVGPALEIADPADLKSILGAGDPRRRYWVKANYHKRGIDGRGWWHRGWISDWRKASYSVDDLIILYLSAAYEGPHCCPVIVRVTREARHEPALVAANGDPEAQDRWPYVTRIECIYEVPIELGVQFDVFGVTPPALQAGYKELEPSQFETAADHLVAAAGASH